MSSYPIEKAVLDQVLARLNAADGFNSLLAAKAADYGIEPFEIDFTGDTDDRSVNFVMGDVDPKDWIDTSPFKFPLVTLFARTIHNQNLQKFHQFAGEVTVGLNVFVQFESPHVVVDFQSLPGCITETLVELFNRARHADPGDQNWSEDVVYNGDISMTRGRLVRGAGFFNQALMYSLTFEVLERGDV